MIIVVMGVSGSGKTTVGRLLAEELGWRFLEGDDFHPPENVAKMSAGIPLTDEDRLPWIDHLHTEIERLERSGKDGIVASSALTDGLRQRLAVDLADLVFVYLKGDPALIQARLSARKGHFFSADLLASQFEALEEPADAYVIDVSAPPRAIVAAILTSLGLDPKALC